MADVREILYPTFSRMYGNPKQVAIYSREELNRLALINSLDNDKNFCSICSYYDNTPVFEDLFFETDNWVVDPVRKVVIWFENHKIPYIILLSGSRGFHLHGLFQSQIVSAKTVKNLSNIILKETGTEEMFDYHVSGVLEKLCRIPNTQRYSNGWCVPITRDELFNINDINVFKNLCSFPRFLDFEIGKRPSILEFVKEDHTESKYIQNIQVAPTKDIIILKGILRPCVYKAILTPNPKNDFRVCAVVEMLNHGLTRYQIFNIFEKLNWIDFQHDHTMYQIEYIEEMHKCGEFTIPYGKKRLKCELNISCIRCILNNT